MKLLYHPAFHKSKKRLTALDVEACQKAIDQFYEDPWRPSLNYERLGKGPKSNHCSIRASLELRVIIAVDSFQNPEVAVLANQGHHDPMYEWAARQEFYTDWREARPLEIAAGPPSQAIAEFMTCEDWQLFLHPRHKRHVDAHHAAEARIRGAAGTGKTVIALHRVAALARRYPNDRILFTTFSRSLVQLMQYRYSKIPDAPEQNVVFKTVDAVAYHVLASVEGGPPMIQDKELTDAFMEAYDRMKPIPTLARLDRNYVRDEIVRVIKGRNASRDKYIDTGRFERMGRMVGFNREAREWCWTLREQWDAELRKRNTEDFVDRLNRATFLVSEGAMAGYYRAAIVDEAQDLTLAGMRLVRTIVAGKPGTRVPPDGILILDDAAQRIYAGGFRLQWAGLKVKGRSVVLKTNYRNSREIMAASVAIRGRALPVREDDDDGAAFAEEYENKVGQKPVFVQRPGDIEFIIQRIERLKHSDHVGYDEIGVLTHRNEDANEVAKELRNKNLPVDLLSEWRDDGRPGDGIRVGTFDRAKGDEYRVVFIPRVGASLFPQRLRDDQLAMPIEDERSGLSDEEKEYRQYQLDRLYVGMTRARERLYLIADEMPCDEIERARDYFDWRQA